MIAFMLQAYGHQILGLKGHGLSVKIRSSDAHAGRAAHHAAQLAHAQAAFLCFNQLIGQRFNNRVHQNLRSGIFFRLTHVHHNKPDVPADLGRGKPDAVRRVHGFRHIFRERAQFGGYFRYRRAFLTQQRIRIGDYL